MSKLLWASMRKHFTIKSRRKRAAEISRLSIDGYKLGPEMGDARITGWAFTSERRPTLTDLHIAFRPQGLGDKSISSRVQLYQDRLYHLPLLLDGCLNVCSSGCSSERPSRLPNPLALQQIPVVREKAKRSAIGATEARATNQRLLRQCT